MFEFEVPIKYEKGKVAAVIATPKMIEVQIADPNDIPITPLQLKDETALYVRVCTVVEDYLIEKELIKVKK